MKKYLMAMVLFLSPTLAMAAVQPADFAYGMPLSLKEGGAVYRLIVPSEVYQAVTQGDLGDLRVFNKAEAVVPYMLRRPKVKNEIHEKKKSLPIFPLYKKINQTSQESLTVRFEKREDGTILDIHSNAGAAAQDRKLMGYIIDASANEEKIDALDIIWQRPAKSFVTEINLEQSTDLTHWSSLVGRITLARMNFQGHQIIRERVFLPLRSVKYIRMLWQGGHDGMEVKSILAVQRRGEPARKREWKPLNGELTDGPEEAAKAITAYEYDAGAQLPVDRIRLRFVEKNTVLKVSLYSRPDSGSPWRYRQNSVFYDLRFDSTALVQDTVSVSETSDRYWRVEIARDALGDPQNIPTVALGWLPHDLLFVARGQGPFLLAYGSAGLVENAAKNTSSDLFTQVIGSNEKGLLKEATAQNKVVLGGQDRLTPEPQRLNWRKWLLWSVLVVGVGLIARMAISLGKDMNKEKG